MKQLTKKEILEVMRYAGNFQREVFLLYDIDIVEVTKYKDFLSASVHYIPSAVSYQKLYSLFREHFKDYRKYINTGECYSIPVRGNERVAHLQIRFYV